MINKIKRELGKEAGKITVGVTVVGMVCIAVLGWIIVGISHNTELAIEAEIKSARAQTAIASLSDRVDDIYKLVRMQAQRQGIPVTSQ